MISEKKKILRNLYIELVKLQKDVIASNFKLIVIINAGKKKVTQNSLIIYFLQQFDYPDKNQKSLVHDYGLVYPATPENIKDKTFE